MRLQGLDFSIQSKAPRTDIFLIRDLFKLMMSSDSEASKARFLYSERGSQDIRFPFTNSIRIGDFWLWGFEGQIFLLPAWPSGHTFSLYKAYLNLSFLTLRLQEPDLCILNVAPRMYNFLVIQTYLSWWFLTLELQGPDFFIPGVAKPTINRISRVSRIRQTSKISDSLVTFQNLLKFSWSGRDCQILPTKYWSVPSNSLEFQYILKNKGNCLIFDWPGLAR